MESSLWDAYEIEGTFLNPIFAVDFLTPSQKEIKVLLHEIFMPILEMRTSTLKQKAVILGMLSRLCQDPQALVEIYLNYDCDSEAADNIYEKYVLRLLAVLH